MMGILTRTTVLYTCDRCGWENEDPFAVNDQFRPGMHSELRLEVNHTGDGYRMMKWLCFACTDDLLKFLAPKRT